MGFPGPQTSSRTHAWYLPPVHVVAIVELAGPIEAEAAALAADLGTTAYEERLKLAAGLPVIVLKSADPEPAAALLAKIRARGHGVIGCDASAVVPSGAMVSMRRFAFEPDALVLPDVPGARLPWDDVLALFRAMHTTRTETLTETKGRKFSAGRALLSGGLMMTKTVASEERSESTERDQVLYVFRAGQETPWLLRERGTHYTGLGTQLGPASAQNFLTTIARLRALAPRAVYDERLMTPRSAPTRASRTASPGTESHAFSSGSGVDLLAHLLAQWISTRPPR